MRNAIMDTTASLVAERGLLSVTMSEIAEKTGIGRATLYKYFPEVEAILLAWHERHIAGHLQQLTEVRDQFTNPGERIEAVLETYASNIYESSHHDTELAVLLHRGDHVTRVGHQLHQLLRALLTEAAEAGLVRNDIPPTQLASYCIHALGASRELPSKAAVRRLAAVTMAVLQQPS